MFNGQIGRWTKPAPATFLAVLFLSSTSVPLWGSFSASAQLFPSQQFPPSSTTTSTVIPIGTRIPVLYEDGERILVKPDETMDVTLTVAANLRNRQGTLLIPYGSKITGRLEPTGRGTRFIAQEIILANSSQRQWIEANSQPVTRTETITRGTDTGEIVQRAAMGAAAAAAISLVTGDRRLSTTNVLIGAGLGALSSIVTGGNNNSVEVISINPRTDLELTLQNSLALR